MIWGETQEERRARLRADEWQPWFAWHPVSLRDGRRAWMTTVNRRRVDGIYWWIYEPRRALDQVKREGGGE